MASIGPRPGVGFRRLISSRKIKPGSPVRQAAATIKSKILRALTLLTFARVRGLIRSNSRLSFTAFMNRSVTPTERLKFEKRPSSILASMKLRMSG